jgi:hypothetical protein
LALAAEVAIKAGEGVRRELSISRSVKGGLQLALVLGREITLELSGEVTTEASREVDAAVGSSASSDRTRTGARCGSTTSKNTRELSLVFGAQVTVQASEGISRELSISRSVKSS